MRTRLLSGMAALLVVASGVVADGFTAPVYAEVTDTCAYGLPCREPTDIEDFTDAFLDGLRVNVTEPSQVTQEAIAEFVASVLGALNSREQAIVDAVNRFRVGEVTVKVRGIIDRRSRMAEPDLGARRDYRDDTASAAHLAHSFLDVTADPATVDGLGQLGMVAYDLYLTSTVAAAEGLPRPEADADLVAVMAQYIEFLGALIRKLTADGTTATQTTQHPSPNPNEQYRTYTCRAFDGTEVIWHQRVVNGVSEVARWQGPDLSQVPSGAWAPGIVGDQEMADIRWGCLMNTVLAWAWRTLGDVEEEQERVENRDDESPVPSTIDYVALGDSYASGSGIGVYQPEPPQACHRSSLAYPGLLDGASTPEGQQLRAVNRACHGAETVHYWLPQSNAGVDAQAAQLSRETTGLVMVSMGGNDLGFERIVRNCLNPFIGGFCGVGAGNPLVPPGQMAQVQDSLTDMYSSILGSIRPDAEVLVLTYPNIAPEQFPDDVPCWVTGALISAEELAMLDRFVAEVTEMITAAAAATADSRIRVLDMSEAFDGHEICTSEPYANHLGTPVFESFHPNARGHQEYARLIMVELGLLHLPPPS